jgi:hypothetical protein
LAAEGLFDQVVEEVGGGGWGEAFGADVGDAVAIGVGEAWFGAEDEIRAERVGGAEAGALAEEDEGELGVLRVADGVLDGDAGKGDDRDRGEVETGGGELGEQAGEERRDLAVGGEGAEAVGEGDRDVGGRGGNGVSEYGSDGVGELAAEIGAEEVGWAVGGGAFQVEDGVVQGGEIAGKLVRVEGVVDGVAGEGVGEVEIEQFARGE